MPDAPRSGTQRNLCSGALALREMGTPSLLVALDYLEPLAEVKPEKLEPAAVRWVEASVITLAESESCPRGTRRAAGWRL